MAVSGTIEWTPDFQDLDLGHRRAYQDVTGTLELVSFIFEFWDCCLSSQSRHLNKHCLQRCYWEFEDPSLCQTLSANSGDTPSKMNYVLYLPIAECSPGPSDNLPCTVPSAYRSGTWIFALGDSYHRTTEEDTIPVDHCDPRGLQPS